MTGLLVSVRNATEAQAAVAGGAALIDVKEPSRGALGPADPSTWKAVLQAVGGRRPVSVALGELLTDRVSELVSQARGIEFAKLALAGCGKTANWPCLWREVMQSLPSGVTEVAVAYADNIQAQAPLPIDVLRHAVARKCKVILFDTFTKLHGGLLDHLPRSSLVPLVKEAHQNDLQVVLAGSLDRSAIKQLLDLAPDYVAVRGAVCRGPRTGALDQELVQNLVDLLHAGDSAA